MNAQTASSSRMGGSSIGRDQLLDAPVDAVATLVQHQRSVGRDARGRPDKVGVDRAPARQVARPAGSS